MKRTHASKRTDIQIHADQAHQGPLSNIAYVTYGQTAIRGANLSAKTLKRIQPWLDQNEIPHKLSVDGGQTWIEKFAPDWHVQ
ncbi:hypothetical protein [Achromobacter xylosoxidans]|uniref:hypothetical protein n=1 Tax=Alcaligenes xylosoxydans xylosoxydans TaxID=85698 RepID=UPI000FD7422C|nr:hypothetical protein [Achromobacter xylosoxidans]MCH4571902.1 hypothetical protein [Achromobacter xylosoxidans]MDD7988144.1 hypothetical protein [Achromobacter xylosoxidans]NEV03810.1 hypothetical protein [Achromobacter xylosoxidans]